MDSTALTAAALDRLKNVRLYAETYGCTYNAGDTEKIIEIAKAQGCTVVDTAEDADAVLINTCIVVDKTEKHMYERMNLFAGKTLIITGCLPGISIERVLEACPDAGIIDPDLIHSCYREVGTVSSGDHAVLQIARGCNGHCTYCITRLARGKLVSFSEEDIVTQAERFVEAGVAEIQLTAQDVSSWGMDMTSGRRLPDLLRSLCKIPGEFHIRVGMANPDTLLPILDDFLDALTDPKIFLFLHVPVQSGSDAVLKTMGRRYTSAEYEEICKRSRERFPDIRISTDYIAGFSGETDADGKASVDQILSTKPGKVNITRFSVRPGTPAAKMKKLPEPIKKERSRALTNAANQVYDANNEAWIGRVVDAVVTEAVRAGSVTARDRTYQNIVVMQEIPLGTKIPVEITGHRRHYLLGRVASE
ncbi:MiaB/RimO family radical SAM methylthiotransferase [Methanorbis rubei]|uniref:Probable threonylcarbamoyladenosine tRNA methylthiotransferase n=1 Tax=Methanorbis rubei TaxID=3028300 RepID=A0AAE4MG29_9EURY|nr:tRNA-2-methylthio-N(6)-dimethylallyladenosine synthase [Methanocorpusculaceae archaeon Cs1]